MPSTLRTLGERLRTNWQDPLIRRNVGLLFLGKAIGLFLVLSLMTRWFLPGLLEAQGAAPAIPAPDPMAAVNAINTVWTLVAAFLVFCLLSGVVYTLNDLFDLERVTVEDVMIPRAQIEAVDLRQVPERSVIVETDFFPRQALAELKLPRTDRERIWPWFWQHRGGFFAGGCSLTRPTKAIWPLSWGLAVPANRR